MKLASNVVECGGIHPGYNLCRNILLPYMNRAKALKIGVAVSTKFWVIIKLEYECAFAHPLLRMVSKRHLIGSTATCGRRLITCNQNGTKRKQP